jgi:hypothetical protein
MLPNVRISGNFSLAEVAKKVPRGIICLLSALRFQDIGRQRPFRSLALPGDDRMTRILRNVSLQFDFDGANLVRAIEATFKRRRAVLPNELPIGLSIEFVSDAGKLLQWDAFVRRSRLDTKEINLETVVKVIADL